ncbi:hypothetical protein ABZ260_42305 [Streptosporangium sp. NPDC006013]|uniref:hypothetical protein n=1 Tax=Streptosporangium sp. NPDC006013 TaxID=3155596 RepID=UPI0033A226ED
MIENLTATEVETALDRAVNSLTAMVVGGALVNRPSDAAGERPVGDTIQVPPR